MCRTATTPGDVTGGGLDYVSVSLPLKRTLVTSRNAAEPNACYFVVLLRTYDALPREVGFKCQNAKVFGDDLGAGDLPMGWMIAGGGWHGWFLSFSRGGRSAITERHVG
jgi:hypothetical protein